jgi:hypothetical protein
MRTERLLAAALGTAVLCAASAPAWAQGSGVRRADPGAGSAADRLALTAPEALLNDAGAAVARGDWSRATELLEQAETRLLTRSTEAGTEGVPSGSPAVQAIVAARESVAARDRARAEERIRGAIAVARVAPASGTGADAARPMPAEGSGLVNTLGGALAPAQPLPATR